MNNSYNSELPAYFFKIRLISKDGLEKTMDWGFKHPPSIFEYPIANTNIKYEPNLEFNDIQVITKRVYHINNTVMVNLCGDNHTQIIKCIYKES